MIGCRQTLSKAKVCQVSEIIALPVVTLMGHLLHYKKELDSSGKLADQAPDMFDSFSYYLGAVHVFGQCLPLTQVRKNVSVRWVGNYVTAL